jgi:hypothetical protein
MPIIGMTQEEILLATAEQVASGASSTARSSKLPGETSSEANARITQAYKDLLARPILTPELEAINAEVKFVRQGAGGVGEYVIVTPIGAKIPANDATEWSVGIIPANSKYVTGTTLGMFSMGDGTVTNVGEVPVTSINKAGEVSTRSFEGQDAYYTQTVGTTGKTQAQLDAAKGQETALQFNKDIATLLGGTIDPATGKVINVAGKTVTSVTPNADGTTTITSSDGTKTTVNTPAGTTTPTTTTPTTTTPSTVTPTSFTPNRSIVSNQSIPTNIDSQTRTLIESLQKQIADLTKQVSTTSTANTIATEQAALAERQRKENALTSLTARFSQYGLQSLVPKIRELVINGSTESTIAFELQETPEYKQRFKANTQRLAKGLAVLDAGTYIGMEDSYRQALRAYGLKQFDTDDYVSQFIANDISANELSNRIVTAVQRVQNADPAITSQLREFYNIGQNDLVAYVLDPNQQFQKIERQVQAAEIGVAARRQGLQAGVGVAEQLAAQGVTQAEAQKGYATIADILPDAKRLSDIYGTTLEGYDQAQGEQEVFNQLASAQRRRQKLTQREIAAFGGQSGLSNKALTTDLTGQY